MRKLFVSVLVLFLVVLIPGLCAQAAETTVYLDAAAGADTNIVLCHPPQHIHTLADVDDTIVNPDTVNASVSELIFKPLPLHPLVGVLLVGCH
jgi:hypothetical protein